MQRAPGAFRGAIFSPGVLCLASHAGARNGARNGRHRARRTARGMAPRMARGSECKGRAGANAAPASRLVFWDSRARERRRDAAGSVEGSRWVRERGERARETPHGTALKGARKGSDERRQRERERARRAARKGAGVGANPKGCRSQRGAVLALGLLGVVARAVLREGRAEKDAGARRMEST